MMSLPDFVTQHQRRIADYLLTVLPNPDESPETLHQAMHYGVMNGGKRLRPLLVYAVGIIFKTEMTLLDPIAAAIEIIHCYSLIHDDLPAMDNDDFRRGLPTCHKRFGEATAILAGDALQPLAFEILIKPLENKLPAAMLVKMMMALASACGADGMAGGQALDMAVTSEDLNRDSAPYVEQMHRQKTGALIACCIRLAALASRCSEEDYQILAQYGECLGFAYQVQDDLFDAAEKSEEHKLTYPKVVGLAAAQAKKDFLQAQALAYLEQLSSQTTLLKELTQFILGTWG